MSRQRPTVRVRRVYEPPEAEDGARVLVDRVWPRGLSRQRAAFDEWLPAVAPSSELRRWYGHDPGRFDEFARRYQAELADAARHEALQHLRDLGRAGPLTLLTATRRVELSHAAVLQGLLGRSR